MTRTEQAKKRELFKKEAQKLLDIRFNKEDVKKKLSHFNYSNGTMTSLLKDMEGDFS